MPDSFSEDVERKLHHSYVRSNVYFPQSRFGFVLALGTVLDEPLLDECLRGHEVGETTEYTRQTAAFADLKHDEYGVSSVIPTSHDRVIQEINKSARVFGRVIKAWIDKAPPRDPAAIIPTFKAQSRKLWRIAVDDGFPSSHLAFVSRKSDARRKTPIRKVDAALHPSASAMLTAMYESCQCESERVYVGALANEIIHTLTVMRAGGLMSEG